jgi:hypothetical protein
MVEATAKFFTFAAQADLARPLISGSNAQMIRNLGDRLSSALRNHRRYGTLVAGDFGSFAPPDIARIMGEEKQTGDICKKR